MSKGKNPFFSLEAHGSVGDAVSVRHSRGVDVLEKKPVPTDPQTLPQIYQRWDYQDYVAQWNDLSEAEKRTWHSNATRFHMTGFAYFMSYNLKYLPDLLARYRLDERGGALAIDTSRNLSHGTVVGALPIKGRIDYGREFDGVNDSVNCGNSDIFTVKAPFSIECHFKPYSGATLNIPRLVAKRNSYLLALSAIANASIQMTFYVGGVPKFAGPPVATLIWDTWHYVCSWWDGTQVFLDLDLTVYAGSLTAGPIDAQPLEDFIIGNNRFNNRTIFGIMDEVRIYDGVLTGADRLRHSLRRYP